MGLNNIHCMSSFLPWISLKAKYKDVSTSLSSGHTLEKGGSEWGHWGVQGSLRQKVPESPDPRETVFLTIFGGSSMALHLSN